ncbi:G2/mitotic-specific cyclin-B-like [Apostichopus japonicus]|uniref:G2/mitotic-specific cyclin-B-like n=1 Tax=Stichopus japonicus TaxID=307972 RepID=UPI003AB4B84C
MALRVRANGNVQLGKRDATLKFENVKTRLAAKSLATKSSHVGTRAALGNISNVATSTGSTSLINAKKVGKKDGKTSRVLGKSKATSSLHSLAAKLPEPIVEQPKSPEAMDFDDILPKMISRPFNVEDIDQDDHESPQLCSEYVKDIYQYMHYLERKYKVEDYMESQEINVRMRTILVDWLVQVHLRFHLLQETLFLTIQLIDRYLALHSVSKNNLQLVGVTAMFIASKYEEMYPPEINDFVYITDNAYTLNQIKSTECLMLKTLDYNLGKPLCLHFLRRNSKAAGVDAQKHTLAKYLMELTLPDYTFVMYDPSEIAAAALCASMRLLEDEAEWDSKMEYYSNYTRGEVAPIVENMAQLILRSETSKYQAVRNKFASSKFMKISTISELKPASVKRYLLDS